MPHLAIDRFDLAAPWQALTPALAPSAAITLVGDAIGHPMAQVAASLRATVLTGATGHRLRRALPAVDLTGFARLEFWMRCDRALTGRPEDPLRIRLRLGSAALSLNAIGNSWGRYLVGQAGAEWSFVTISLGDLPVAIRSAVSQIEFVVVATDGAETRLWLDGLMAAAPQLTFDVDQALLQMLDGVLILGGNPVPGRVAPAVAPNPYIRVTQYRARRARERDPVGFRRYERDDAGLLVWPAPEAWELTYLIEPLAITRAEIATMLDFVQGQFGRQWLSVGNRVNRIEPSDMLVEGDEALTLPPLRYVVSAWSDAGVPRRELPVTVSQMSFGIQPAGA